MNKLEGFYVDLDLIDPFLLFGLEEYLQENFNTIYIVFSSLLPSVILGRTSRISEEIYLDNIVKDGLILARRRSGGGVVYIKPHQLCVSFIFPRIYLPKDLLEKYEFITLLLTKSLERFTQSLSYDERGNIFARDGKISGCGSFLSKTSYLHHLTIIREPLLNMERYLKRIKFATSYIRIPKEDLKGEILNQVEKNLGISLDGVNINSSNYEKIAEKYRDEKFIYRL